MLVSLTAEELTSVFFSLHEESRAGHNRAKKNAAYIEKS